MATTTPSYLAPYSQQTQDAVKNAGLNTVMAAVNSNSKISDITKEGLTPQAVSTYKDASGNTVKASPNTYYVSNPDGSGGALNYFFQIDPKTGVTTPINNPVQNLTYTPGSPGGFVNQVISDIKPLVPIAEAAASAFIPGAAPIIAGYNAAQSVASGKPINIGTALNIATALSGTNILPPEAAATLKTANQTLAAANALKTGNVTGLINSIVQMTGASSDVRAATNALNAATAISKGDVAGALNALNNLTGSVDPKVANLATTVLKQIESTNSASTVIPAISAATSALTSDATAPSATQAQTQTQTSEDSAGPNVIQSMQLASALGVPTSTIFKKPKKYFGATAEQINPQTGKVEFVDVDPSTILPAGSAGMTNTPVANTAQTSENVSTPSVDNIANSDVTFDDILNILRG
jgi:hypothetical protein